MERNKKQNTFSPSPLDILLCNGITFIVRNCNFPSIFCVQRKESFQYDKHVFNRIKHDIRRRRSSFQIEKESRLFSSNLVVLQLVYTDPISFSQMFKTKWLFSLCLRLILIFLLRTPLFHHLFLSFLVGSISFSFLLWNPFFFFFFFFNVIFPLLFLSKWVICFSYTWRN